MASRQIARRLRAMPRESNRMPQPIRFSPAFSSWCTVTGQPGNWASSPSLLSALLRKRNASIRYVLASVSIVTRPKPLLFWCARSYGSGAVPTSGLPIA